MTSTFMLALAGVVLVGLPICWFFENRSRATHAVPPGVPSLVPEDAMQRAEMESWIDRSSLTDNPIENGDKSAGNAVPGLTLPLFCTMIEKISFRQIADTEAVDSELRICLDGV